MFFLSIDFNYALSKEVFRAVCWEARVGASHRMTNFSPSLPARGRNPQRSQGRSSWMPVDGDCVVQVRFGLQPGPVD